MSTWTMTGSGYFAASNRPLRDTKLAPNAPPLEPALLGSATSPAAKGRNDRASHSTRLALKSNDLGGGEAWHTHGLSRRFELQFLTAPHDHESCLCHRPLAGAEVVQVPAVACQRSQ